MIGDENTTKKSCFVISPIGDENGDIRARADKVLHYVLTPPVEECGYGTPVRADAISEPGLITSQIIDHLLDDILLIRESVPLIRGLRRRVPERLDAVSDVRAVRDTDIG